MKRENKIFTNEQAHLRRMLVTFTAILAVVLVIITKGAIFESFG
jgi:hypothetical protein